MGIKKNKYMGVDVSKDTLDYWISGALKSKRVRNEQGSCKRLAELCLKEGVSQVIFEFTGGYEKLLADTLSAAGVSYSKVAPLKARRFAQTLGKHAKNDRIDSYVLHEYGSKMTPLVTQPQSAEVDHLKLLLSRRQQLVKMQTAEKNHFQQPLSNDQIKQSVKSYIKRINQDIKALERDILNLITKSTELKAKYNLLTSFKGVSIVTATTLLTYLPELGYLDRTNIAAIVGVAPMDNQTGQFQGARKCKGGRQCVRDALYMAAVSAIKHNPIIRRHYVNLKSKGKQSMKAIVACMRKIVVTLNAILRDNKPWDEKRFITAKYTRVN